MRGAVKRVKNKRQCGLKAAKNGGRLGQKVTCNILYYIWDAYSGHKAYSEIPSGATIGSATPVAILLQASL